MSKARPFGLPRESESHLIPRTERDLDHAQLIGSQSGDTAATQSFQYVEIGMTVSIAHSARDQRNARTHSIQPRGSCRSIAAVMSDFEQVYGMGLTRPHRGQDLTFAGRF